MRRWTRRLALGLGALAALASASAWTAAAGLRATVSPRTVPSVLSPVLPVPAGLGVALAPAAFSPGAALSPAWSPAGAVLPLPVAAPLVLPAAPSVPSVAALAAPDAAAAPQAAGAPQTARVPGADAPLESFWAGAGRSFDNNAPAPAVDLRPATPSPAALSGPVRIVITGPPGSGKGTYAARLSLEYGVPHISVGELLRAHAKSHPDVAAIMSQGKLVDTDLVLKVVAERLSQPDARERGFILDGFPRRLEEARALKGMLGPAGVDLVIALDVPEAELLRRILARGRADDNAEVFAERMRIYREQSLPAADLMRSNAAVIAPEVKGSDADSNYAGLKALFEKWARSLGLLRGGR